MLSGCVMLARIGVVGICEGFRLADNEQKRIPAHGEGMYEKQWDRGENRRQWSSN